MIKKETIYINNRKARYNYYIEEVYHAGIILKGSEVKSMRVGKASIIDSYCYINNGEIFLKNAMVASANNAMFSHKEIHDRKLLLHKKEIKKLTKATSIKGYTIIPLKIIVPVKGFIKIDIALCIGKHFYDKRNVIKERDYQKQKNINY